MYLITLLILHNWAGQSSSSNIACLTHGPLTEDLVNEPSHTGGRGLGALGITGLTGSTSGGGGSDKSSWRSVGF